MLTRHVNLHLGFVYVHVNINPVADVGMLGPMQGLCVVDSSVANPVERLETPGTLHQMTDAVNNVWFFLSRYIPENWSSCVDDMVDNGIVLFLTSMNYVNDKTRIRLSKNRKHEEIFLQIGSGRSIYQ